jgi:hypothetical protein
MANSLILTFHRKLGDHTYLSWDKEPTARTTGRAPTAGEAAT